MLPTPTVKHTLTEMHVKVGDAPTNCTAIHEFTVDPRGVHPNVRG